MARRNNDRYVRYYTVGSAAAKLEPEARKASLPKYRNPEKRKPIPFDPVAFVGSAVAVLLAVLMVVGLIQVAGAAAQVRELEIRMAALEREEEILMERYESGYDLDEIRIAAHSMGMIPVEEAAHVRVEIPTVIVETPRVSWWDTLMGNLRQFFA